MIGGRIAPYNVFVSHGWHDRWIAQKMAEAIKRAQATAFIDIFDVASGDRIEPKVHEGLTSCSELVSLLTPWSVDQTELGVERNSWRLGFAKTICGRDVSDCTLDDIDKKHGGLAVLSPTNVITLNDFDQYVRELKARVGKKLKA